MPSSDKYSFLESLLFPPTRLNESKLKENVQGKNVLITGASYGIGESLAYKLAETGVNLILVARTEEKLQEIKINVEKMGGRAEIFPTDLTQPEQIKSLLAKLNQLPGGIDIFINNAGKSIRRSIKDSLERFHDFTRTMALNYFGPVQLMLDLIPVLEKNRGHVINISAVNVLLAPAPFWAAYQASKSAFDNWFRCVAPELNAAGVKTTTIYLPLVRTRMIEPTKEYRDMPAMKPEHVARIICKALYTGKKYHKPWWLIFGQLSSIIFLSSWETMMTGFVRKSNRKRILNAKESSARLSE